MVFTILSFVNFLIDMKYRFEGDYMRILQLNMTYGNGSTGKILKDLSSALTTNNIKIYSAFGFYDNPDRNIYKVLRGKSTFYVKYNLGLTYLTGFHGCFHKKDTIKLIKWIDKIGPDLIHIHNIHGNWIHLETLFDYLKRSGKPIVWTLHDCWPFTGQCAYFEYIKCFKWIDGCHDCINLNTYPKSFFFDHSKEQWIKKKEMFNGFDNLIIVTPSEWLSKYVSRSFLGGYEIEVIHNGIDLEIFKPCENNVRETYGILKNKKILLGVANSWSSRKGLNQLIKLNELIDDHYQMIIVGLNHRQLKKLPNSIIGIERTNSRESLVKLYSAADVFVNPTLEDNFPTTNLEAMACGTPVVTFNTGGSPEALTPDTGIVVFKKNEFELLKAIKEVLTFSDIENKCRNNAKRFSKEIFTKKYMNIYTRLYENNIN